jgi:hypothetical protein
MLILFEQLLGREFWKYVILVFTHVDENIRDLLEDNIDVLEDPNGKFLLCGLTIHVMPPFPQNQKKRKKNSSISL